MIASGLIFPSTPLATRRCLRGGSARLLKTGGLTLGGNCPPLPAYNIPHSNQKRATKNNILEEIIQIFGEKLQPDFVFKEGKKGVL